MQLGKRCFAKLNTGFINGAIVGLVLIAILFELSAVLFPQVQTSAATLCNSGIPLASLFKSSGVVILILVAALILVVVKAAMPGKGK